MEVKKRFQRGSPGTLLCRTISAAALVAGLCNTAATASMEIFLRIGAPDGQLQRVGSGIDDASVPTPDGWFPIRFSGQSIGAESSWLKGAAPSVGKPHSGDFTFTKQVNFASPALLKAILTGSGFTTAEMVIRDADATQGPFYSVLLKNILIRSVSHARAAADGTSTANEDVALAYAAIEWSYQRLGADGKAVFSSVINWDQPAGTFENGPFIGVLRPRPYAVPDLVVRSAGAGAVLGVGTLLGNDAPDLGFDGLVSESTSLGGSLLLSGANVIYTPPTPDTGADDSFSYSVQNQSGAKGEAKVTIRVQGVASPPQLGLKVSAQAVDIELKANSGRRYQLQFVDSLGDEWTNLGLPVLADSAGKVTWSDTTQSGARYYRAYLAP